MNVADKCAAQLVSLVQTGNPTIDGRYVAFVRCQAVAARDWVEPLIVTWANGRWHTTFLPVSRIEGWIGPLPVLKVSEIDPPPPAMEFDL